MYQREEKEKRGDDQQEGIYLTWSTDFGKTWTNLSKGLPEDGTAYVVRENPNKKGFLVAGTGTGLFSSTDAGASWKPLKANFPNTPVWDVKFVKASHDLVVATFVGALVIGCALVVWQVRSFRQAAANGLVAIEGNATRSAVLMQADVKIFDPIVNTADITSRFALMVYDTLFSLDENLVPQPQMVGKYDVSADGLTYTFKLRSGVLWHDGAIFVASPLRTMAPSIFATW